MKRCPTCQRTYTDDTQRFCLEDGTILVGGEAAPSDPMAATLIDSPPRDTSSNRSAPTEVLRSDPTFERQSPPSPSWPTTPTPQPVSRPVAGRSQPDQYAPFVSPSSREAEKRTWPAVATLAIGVITVLMFVSSLVGAGFKMRSELIGFLFLAGMFLGIGGAILGAVVLIIAIRSPERYGGKGIAVGGLLLNLLPTLLLAVLLAIGIAVS